MQPTKVGRDVQKGKSVATGLCPECSVSHHYYQEILAHDEGDEYFLDVPLPAAWIDGRRHRLHTPVSEQSAECKECKKRVPAIYLPIE
jgi:hypothetical protein